MRTPSEINIQNFHSHVKKGGDNECWEWTGYKQKSGHGQFKYKGVVVYAHRFAFFLLNMDTFDDSLCVCHTCNNPSCVNPNHLYDGTHQQNTDDMMKSGRYAKGKSVGAVLTEEQVLEIKREYDTGKFKQSELAIKYGCAQSQISRITTGRRWVYLHGGVGTVPANS